MPHINSCNRKLTSIRLNQEKSLKDDKHAETWQPRCMKCIQEFENKYKIFIKFEIHGFTDLSENLYVYSLNYNENQQTVE